MKAKIDKRQSGGLFDVCFEVGRIGDHDDGQTIDVEQPTYNEDEVQSMAEAAMRKQIG